MEKKIRARMKKLGYPEIRILQEIKEYQWQKNNPNPKGDEDENITSNSGLCPCSIQT